LGWVLWPSGTSASSTPTVDAEAQNRLTALLPAGYSEDACTPAEASKGAVAMVNCEEHQRWWAAFGDLRANEGRSRAERRGRRGPCGRRRRRLPGQHSVAGSVASQRHPAEGRRTLVCGMPHGQPQVVWTNDAQLVLNVVRAGPEGPTLDQMYAWWSDHS
jgi:serine/threonine kinase PknH